MLKNKTHTDHDRGIYTEAYNVDQPKEGKAVVAWRVIHRDGWRLPTVNQIRK